MIFAGRKDIDEILCAESEQCFSSDEWMGIMESDGVRFEDGESVKWAMAAILRGVKEPNTPSLYEVCFDYFLPSRAKNVLQTLVSSILLPRSMFLSSISCSGGAPQVDRKMLADDSSVKGQKG